MLVTRYRLFPTKKQISIIKKMMKAHCELYNNCLEERKNDKDTSVYNQIKSQVKPVKNKYDHVELNTSSMQQTVRRLQKAYSAYFKKHNSHPRFKNKFRSIEYSKHGDGWKLNERLYIQGVGDVKISKSVRYKNPTRLNIIWDGYKCFAVITFKDFKPQPTNKTTKKIGFDLGMQKFLVDSDGKEYENPQYLKRKLKEIQKVERKKDRDPKRYQKTLYKLHKKVANQRHDFLHKLTNKIILENQFIAIEDVDNQKLKFEIANINRKKSDLAWGKFVEMLTYKAESAGRQLVKVNPAYTSQICSTCGEKIPKELKDRVHKCDHCGLEMDRDHNAARNILNIAVGLDGLAPA